MQMPESFKKTVNDRLARIQAMAGIKPLFWSLRGSLDIGIYRNNSDADIIFVFSSTDQDYRAFHDIVGHGIDLWGWNIEDALKTIRFCSTNDLKIIKKDQCAISDEHRRGSLSYYFGLYVTIGNDFCVDLDGFLTSSYDRWIQLYNPTIAIAEMQGRLEPICQKIKNGQDLSGNECVYGLWYALMEKSLQRDRLPGDNKISTLIDCYGNAGLLNEFKTIHNYYKESSGKKGQKFKNVAINDWLINSFDETEAYMEKADLRVEDIQSKIDQIMAICKTYG